MLWEGGKGSAEHLEGEEEWGARQENGEEGGGGGKEEKEA